MMAEVRKLNYYLLPGMGADHRLYDKMELKNGDVHFLDWIPSQQSRNLADYAQLISQRITTSDNIIIGSSMGGMVAVEISKIIQPLSTILISAPTGRHQFPASLKALRVLKFHKIIGESMVMKVSGLANLFMGFHNEEEKALFFDMLKGNGSSFLHFSVGAVLEWSNIEEPIGDYLQILGSEDRLFKPSKMKVPPVVLSGGGHFTAYQKGPEISEIINKYVQNKFLNR
jgi:pimeloyl-ACP methyl ester carboxylesterase